MKNRLDLNYEKLLNLNEQPRNMIPLDRGEGVPSFDEMVIIVSEEQTLTMRLRTCKDVAP